MTEELKEKEECKCFCRSEGVRQFLITALGTFVGVYFALCLFAALHRPPMMAPMAFGHHFGMHSGCPCKMIKHHPHFIKGMGFEKGDFQKPNGWQKGPAPFEANRPETK